MAICEPKALPCDIHVFGARLRMDSWMVNSQRSIWVFFKNSFDCAFVGESSQHLSLKIHSHIVDGPMIFSFVHAKCNE